jgi:hypothetical protein
MRPAITKIDLGHDGAHQLTLEYSEPFNMEYLGAWWFCRDGQQIRHIDSRYLEQRLIDKIVSLINQ